MDLSLAHKVLAAAVALAKPGDRVTVEAGVYRETLRPPAGTAWQGEPGAIIDGGWNGQTVEGDFGGVVGCAAPGVVVDQLQDARYILRSRRPDIHMALRVVV